MNIILRSFVFYFILIGLCFLFRLGFLLVHFDFTLSDMAESIFSGLRFDMQYCGYFASIYCIFSFLGKFVSRVFFNIIVFLVLFAELTFVVFFNIYHKKIDQNLFLFKNEKLSDLITTALGENYGIIPAILIFFIAIFALNYLHEKVLKSKISFGITKSAGLFIIFALSMMLSINQQFHYKAKSLFNETKAFDNAALQASTFGHLKAFGSTLQDFYKMKKIDFKYFNVGTPNEALTAVFGVEKGDLYELIKQQKSDGSSIKAKKIYYIISESLSDWVMNEHFSELFSDIQDFAKNASYIKALHNANNTAESLQNQFLGIYNTGDDNLTKYNQIIPPRTSLIEQFSALGYTSDFYFGGARNWAGLFDFTTHLGIHKNYDKEHIYAANINELNPPMKNYWGAYDDYLFEFVRRNSKQNSLNIIMTTTNHPKYDLSFMQKNDFPIPFEKIEKLSTKYKNELATVYWYQKTLIKWIKKTAALEPESLFIITGDHYGRYNIDDSFDLALTNTVPVIFYYPSAKIYPTCKITNHLDIAASIINLIAPKGYEYTSFGQPCFSLEEKEILANNKYGFDIAFVDGKITSGEDYLQKLQALSWYLVYKGNIIK